MKTVNLSKIIQLINSGNFSKAEIEIRGLVENQPNNFSLNKMYGITLLGQNQYLPAIDAFLNCYNLKNDDYDVNVNLSYLFIKIQDYKKSLKYSELSIEVDNNRPEAYQNIAECYLNLKRFNDAEKNILIAIEKRGGLDSKEMLKFKDTLNLYGDIILAKKEEEKFCNLANKILDKGVHDNRMLISLIRIDINKVKKSYLDNMNNILNNINSVKPLLLKTITESNIYFVLAEYLQKKDKKISEKYYLKANELIATIQRGTLFHRQKRISKIINHFEACRISNSNSSISLNKGKGLIFIIGMPRSGTTLVESIISTADNCVAGGEKLFFSLKCNQFLSGKHKSDYNTSFLEELGDEYLSTIDIQKNGKGFFTDKLPENYLYVKFIKDALPAAKFIIINRDPWDNAISLFKQNYASNLPYTSSFFGIALEYANYEHIIEYWVKTSGQNPFLNINYEELVSNTQKMATKIWDYCNLEGEYLEKKREGFFSLTASKQQVTKNIYQTSLNKGDFKDYKLKFLDDLEQQRKYWRDNTG